MPRMHALPALAAHGRHRVQLGRRARHAAQHGALRDRGLARCSHASHRPYVPRGVATDTDAVLLCCIRLARAHAKRRRACLPDQHKRADTPWQSTAHSGVGRSVGSARSRGRRESTAVPAVRAACGLFGSTGGWDGAMTTIAVAPNSPAQGSPRQAAAAAAAAEAARERGDTDERWPADEGGLPGVPGRERDAIDERCDCCGTRPIGPAPEPPLGSTRSRWSGRQRSGGTRRSGGVNSACSISTRRAVHGIEHPKKQGRGRTRRSGHDSAGSRHSRSKVRIGELAIRPQL